VTDEDTLDCVVAGGGPAGMVLGYLLARAGLRVTVLEKHADFLRDFRGDTIHPSTLTLLRELGLVEDFLRLPVNRVTTLDAVVDGTRVTVADFGALPGPDAVLVLAPQWDLLDFLARRAGRLPGFRLLMSTTVERAVVERGRVVGVEVSGPDGERTLRAALTVAADGRGSRLREVTGAPPVESGVPVDVLWFHLPKPSDAPPDTLAYVGGDGLVLTIDRGDRYQAGHIIAKGGFDALRAAGLPAFRACLARVAPHLEGPARTLTDWSQVKLLSVQVNRLPQWHRPGFIAIGDAAHAMSPMFGVGVNYAVQDAVALANALAPVLLRLKEARNRAADDRSGATPPDRRLAERLAGELDSALAAVQRRRERPVRRMQRLQVLGHRRIARPPRGDRFAPRWVGPVLRVVTPRLRRRVAHFVGVGFLPEHPSPLLLRSAHPADGEIE
jgi:2-polyprenyl-6-methoxyphenol hydroxylase-like FAD-dependent oxidoreductase